MRPERQFDFDQIKSRVVRELRWRKIPPWDADDIAQETLAAIWAKRNDPELRDPIALAVIIARNKAINHLRKRCRDRTRMRCGYDENDVAVPTCVYRGGCPTENVKPSDAFHTHAIERARKFLSDKQNAVIQLRFFEGKSLGESSRIMRCSRSAVSSFEKRAIAALRRRLSPPENLGSAKP